MIKAAAHIAVVVMSTCQGTSPEELTVLANIVRAASAVPAPQQKPYAARALQSQDSS